MIHIENKFLDDIRRTGPRPIWLHLQYATEYAAKVDDYTLYERYLEGINKYFHYEISSKEKQVYETIWQKDNVRLLQKSQQRNAGPYVLLIPSLINGYEVFDLTTQYSFYDFLSAQGFRPIILDWGRPKSLDKDKIESYILDYLIPAKSYLKQEDQQLICFGYCLGGLLLLGANQVLRNSKTLNVFSATPWDFSFYSSEMKENARHIVQFLNKTQTNSAFTDLDIIQAFFASIDKDYNIQKFINFLDMKEKDEKDLFVAVEDWLNHGNALHTNVFRTCLQEWLLENKTSKGDWCIGKIFIKPEYNRQKSLVIVPKQDKLVPPEAARSLYHQLPNAEILEPDLGHIGLMASRTAQQKMWMPMVKWINKALNSSSSHYKSVA